MRTVGKPDVASLTLFQRTRVVVNGLREVRMHSVIDTAGEEHPVDTIFYGTSFPESTADRFEPTLS